MLGVLRELASLALVVGLIVTGTAMLVLVIGHGAPPSGRGRGDRGQGSSRLGSPPGPRPKPLGTTPSSAVAAARARALAAAAELAPTDPTESSSPPEPLLALPAETDIEDAEIVWPDDAASVRDGGQTAGEPDVPVGRLDPSTEELRAVIDRLIEKNPDFLAEVITKWIRSESGAEPRSPTARSRTTAQRRPG